MASARALPGAIRQIAYVVRDMDAAIEEWLGHGVGPWFVLRSFRQHGATFRGRSAEPLLCLAMANSGPLQIELLAQLDDTPSSYREFLDSGREGFHHVSYWTDDFDSSLARAAEQPWQVVQQGISRSVYLDTGGATSTLVEIAELTERYRRLTDTVRDAASEWDGVSDPVRELSPPPHGVETAG
ncbi:VOC family protein [Pseudonocardia oroxyli]|uniref:Glyoxalase/Bleomycin resistance protein/Dioxygenase superfamily protein n=1 Tax=Pseudonocardia oroxyli TaxID=366584 RepID=A0A1G7TGX8_PSEOR|nr:VOC family protein [Pseudonocardia oroxyli]SDG34563.1 Glyoxalase/Bleomycin resistance protein/Dioxygenase superfamily protein [Pseudonocardia oroxyli]